MSLLTIFNRMAENVGIAEAAQVITSPARDCAEAVAMSNAIGDELARRVDFGALHAVSVVTGDGTNNTFSLGAAFSRIIPGVGVSYAGNAVRPLTHAEWATLTPVVGVPRYFLLEGSRITLWPYLALGDTVLVRYQSRNWCSNNSAAWTADDNTSLIDDALMAKGLIARWRRQKGMPFEDFEAEYEAALSDIAGFDDRSRI